MADKLALYNVALLHLGERKLSSLTDAIEPRRVLDQYYLETLQHCLEAGNWRFAHRSVSIAASGSVTPDFGFTYAFAKPNDLLRISRISESADLEIPLLSYREENEYWYADTTPIYLEYVSNSTTLGGRDLSRWPQHFADYFAARLARQAAPRICGLSAGRPEDAAKLDKLERLEAIAKAEALEHNAVADAPAPDVVRYCLEQAPWKFATKTSKLSPSVPNAPAFGFDNAFAVPTDLVRVITLSDNEYLDPPLSRLNLENGYWQADCSFLYVRYVSNNSSYGLNRSRWPQSFKDFVEARSAVVKFMKMVEEGKAPVPQEGEGNPLNALQTAEALALAKAVEHNSRGDSASPDIVKYCLEQAPWKFALKIAKISPTVLGALAFGFDNAFLKPTDWVRTVTIADNEYQDPPLSRFLDQTTYWHADSSFLYVTYVSNSTSYGADQTKWTQSFKDFVSARTALVTFLNNPPATEDKDALQKLVAMEQAAFTKALEHNSLGDSAPADVIKHCLEKAPWKFALRIDEIDPTGAAEPEFGFQNAFLKPTDWVRTVDLSDSETFDPPLMRFSEQGGYWHADCDPLFVRYISNNSSYGADQTKWPQSFKDYVDARVKLLVYLKRPDARVDVIEKLERMEKKALGAAREHNAVATAPQFSPRGSWVTSRGGGRTSGSRWDGTTI